MTSAYKPEGYTSVAPYLIVANAKETLLFLETVFGAQRLRIHESETGRLMHAEVRIDDTVLMFSDPMEGWPAIASHVHIYVTDADATYTRALEAGAESVQAPVQKGDVDKRGGFRDAGGTTWWIATQVG